jgi:hypothetical protein
MASPYSWVPAVGLIDPSRLIGRHMTQLVLSAPTNPKFDIMYKSDNNTTAARVEWALPNMGRKIKISAADGAPVTTSQHIETRAASPISHGVVALYASEDTIYSKDLQAFDRYAEEVEATIADAFKSLSDYMFGGDTTAIEITSGGNPWPTFVPGLPNSILEDRDFGSQTNTLYGVAKNNAKLIDAQQKVGFHNQYKELDPAAFTYLELAEFLYNMTRGSYGLTGKIVVGLPHDVYLRAYELSTTNSAWRNTMASDVIALGASFQFPTISGVTIVDAPEMDNAVVGASGANPGKRVLGIALHEKALVTWLTAKDVPTVNQMVFGGDPTYAMLNTVADNVDAVKRALDFNVNKDGVLPIQAVASRMFRPQTPERVPGKNTETWQQNISMYNTTIAYRLSATGVLVEA